MDMGGLVYTLDSRSSACMYEHVRAWMDFPRPVVPIPGRLALSRRLYRLLLPVGRLTGVCWRSMLHIVGSRLALMLPLAG